MVQIKTCPSLQKVLLDSVELESRKTISAFRGGRLYLREGKGLETGVTEKKKCLPLKQEKKMKSYVSCDWVQKARPCKWPGMWLTR